MSPTSLRATMHAPASPALDDERRAPMGLTERESCRQCHGPVHRTDASGLCWSCMPTG